VLPGNRVFPLLDPLLCSATIIVKLDHIFRVLGQVGHNEADTREQLDRVPRDVADAKISPDMGSCDKTPRLVPRASHGTCELLLDFPFQDGVGLEANHLTISFFLQPTVQGRVGKGRIARKNFGIFK